MACARYLFLLCTASYLQVGGRIFFDAKNIERKNCTLLRRFVHVCEHAHMHTCPVCMCMQTHMHTLRLSYLATVYYVVSEGCR